MADEISAKNGASHRPNIEIERIETVSSSTTPWSIRLIFGILGVVFLGAALAAWQFRALFEGHIALALPYIIIALAVFGVGAIVESITTEIWLALIAGIIALAVTYLIVGRDQVYPAPGTGLFMVDRFTGGVQYCTPDGCKVLQEVKDLPKLPVPLPPEVQTVISGPLPPPAAAPLQNPPAPNPPVQNAAPQNTQPAGSPAKPAPGKVGKK
jgi:hypothetical protein